MITRLFLLFLVVLPTYALVAQAPAESIDRSIAVLRNIPLKGLSEEQKEAKAKQIDDAWKTLIAAGAVGADRLKKEVAKVDAGKEKDDFFKLSASVVLWKIGKAAEADYIANIWTTTPIATQYTYVFYTAFEAAQTQDPRVLPMLKALLRDDKGGLFISAHAMPVGWPLSLEFVWGVYGPAGIPVLAEILEKSTDDVEIRSAIVLLAKAQYLPSLPRVRQLTTSKAPLVRQQAIQSLGVFGHPDDYERLIAGTSSIDPMDIFSSAFALYEFEDERAVPHLIPLLAKGNDQSRVEVTLALLHLLTPESLAAVKKFVASLQNKELKEYIARSVTLREEKLPKGYERRPRAEQGQLMDKIRNADLLIPPGDKPFTNAQLLEALKVWREKGRIYDSGVEWPGEARMIAAAKPENIEQMQATKAAFYRRLSDECLYETRDIDKVIKYVGRTRYRRGFGVTPRAEPK